MQDTGKRWVLGAIVLLLFLASPALSLRLDPAAYEGGRSRSVHERAARERDR